MPKVLESAKQSKREAIEQFNHRTRRGDRRSWVEKFHFAVPKLFWKAHLRHLSPGLQKKIQELPGDKGLLLWGQKGVGKSYAMAAIMRMFWLRGRSCRRILYDFLCLCLRDTYKPKSTQTELSIIQPLIKVDKLFIEDVGTTVSPGRQESDFSLRTFLLLIDQRLESKKATFITTNRNFEELASSFDERVASRLRACCEIVHLTGRDKREGK